MGARERAEGQARLLYPRLASVRESDEGDESDEHLPDWWAGEARARSATVSSADEPARADEEDGDRSPGSDAGRSYNRAMARDIRARQAAVAAERDGASARNATTSEIDSRKPGAPAKTTPPERPWVDRRPVRGVATIQALPSRTAKAESMLLVVGRGKLSLQTVQRPYQRLLEMKLADVAAEVVPGRNDMFRVSMTGSNPDAAGIFVVLRDHLLRDSWLQALLTAGAHVDVAGTCLRASTGGMSYPDAPVRWLR